MIERRAATVAWIAWLIGLAWMIVTFRAQVLQPNFWPLVLLLAVQVLAAAVASCRGLWRLVQGPRRAAAMGWMLLGMGPVCLWAAHLSYGVWFLQGRQLDPNLLIQMSRPVSLALGDALTRVLYRERTEGRYVIMIHNGDLNSPQQDVAAMDAHLKRMQDFFGRKMQSKVRWVRGSMLGVSGRGGDGWALGSTDTKQRETGELAYLDRHEVAHAIMETLDHAEYRLPTDHDVPAIVIEGWAETQSDFPDMFLVQRAWDQRRSGLTLSLRELTSEDWYRRHRGPAYDQGSALVEYLLHEFGSEKFFELYVTCRRETFEEDCQRIFGVNLDELDRAYWEYVEQQINPNETGGLAFVELAPEVDEELWREFVREHLAAAEQARQLSGRMRAQMEIVSEYPAAKPLPMQRVDFLDLLIDGGRWRLLEHFDERKQLTVATPSRCFSLHQSAESDGWQPRDGTWMGEELQYPYLRQSILADAWALLGHYSLVEGESAVWNSRSDPYVTQIERVSRDGLELIRIAFVNRDDTTGRVGYSSGELYAEPASAWAIRLADLRDDREDDSVRHGRLSFELQPRGDEPPLLQSHQGEWKNGEETTLIRHFSNSYDFAPQITEADFSSETYGVALPQRQPARRPAWYVLLSLALVLVSLVGGTVTLMTDRWLARRKT
jgi:hypothetical protein